VIRAPVVHDRPSDSSRTGSGVTYTTWTSLGLIATVMLSSLGQGPRRDTPSSARSSTEPVRCCCCEVGHCPCGCDPVARPDPESKHDGPKACPCGDQPKVAPAPTRVVVHRPISVGCLAPCGSDFGTQQWGPELASPQAHAPPPEIALLHTIIILA